MRGLWRRPKPAAVLPHEPLIDVAVGSFASIWAHSSEVRFTPDSDRRAHVLPCPKKCQLLP
jgi:hypothetical protein